MADFADRHEARSSAVQQPKLKHVGRQVQAAARVQPLETQTSDLTCAPAYHRASFSFFFDTDPENPAAAPAFDVPAKRKDSRSSAAKSAVRRLTRSVRGCFDRMIKRDRNKVFGNNVELAIRVAFLVVALGVPLMCHHSIPCITPLVEKGWITPVSLQYVFITQSKSMGATVRQVCNSIVGDIFAIVGIGILLLCFPAGVFEDTPPLNFWGGMVEGIAFIFFMLWLNVPMTTSVFACSRFVVWWMDFLNPHNSTDVLVAFSQEFAAAVFGGLMSVLANLVPYPILATHQCQTCAKEFAHVLMQGWEDFTDYFCSEDPQFIRRSRLVRDVKTLEQRSKDLEHLLVDAQWEWDLRPRQRFQSIRRMLNRQNASLSASCGRLFGVQFLCIREDFGPEHDALMMLIRPYIMTAVTIAGQLMVKCVEAACDGDISKDEAEDMRSVKANVRRAMTELTTVYLETKGKPLLQDSLGNVIDIPEISESLLDEDAFCFEVCAFCRFAMENAEDLLADQDGTRILTETDSMPRDGGFSAAFDPEVLFSRDQVKFALQNGLTILSGFFLGFNSRGILLHLYDSSVAALIALLIKKAGGSALVRSLARLQGMVIGLVIGSVSNTFIYILLGMCGLSGHIVMLSLLFVYTCVAMFIFFHSVPGSNNAYVGQLLSIVGTPAMVTPCFIAQEYNYRDSQIKTNSIVIVVILMALVNNLFAVRVSEQAYHAFLDAWNYFQETTTQVFSSDTEIAGSYTLGAFRARLNKAEMLGLEAAAEPRYWRVPWKEELFIRSVEQLERMRLCMRSIQSSGSSNHTGTGKRSTLFTAVLQMPTFLKLTDILKLKQDQIEYLLKIFLQETSEPTVEMNDAQMLEDNLIDWKESMGAFVAEVSRPDNVIAKLIRSTSHFGKGPPDITSMSLEDNYGTEVSRVVLDLSALMHELQELQCELLVS